MEIFLFLILVILLVCLLFYIDKKMEYREIPIILYTKENGDFYFAVKVNFWQKRKLEQAKRIYRQHTLVNFEGFTYQITNYGGIYPATNGLFFERELRYFGQPLLLEERIDYTNIIINQYGNGTISLDLSKNESQCEVIAIENYLSQDTNLNVADKAALEEFLEKVKNHQTIKNEELNTIYNIFIKYEPLASLGLNLFSAIQSLFK